MSLVGDVCIILTEKIFSVVCFLTVVRGWSALQQRLLNVNLSIAANVCRRKPRPFALRTTLTMLHQATSAHYDENSRLKIRDPGWRKRYCCWHLTNDVIVSTSSECGNFECLIACSFCLQKAVKQQLLINVWLLCMVYLLQLLLFCKLVELQSSGFTAEYCCKSPCVLLCYLSIVLMWHIILNT